MFFRRNPHHVGPCGLVGKIPGQRDYLKLNASEPIVQGFHDWLQECMETLQQNRLELPPAPVVFGYHDPAPSNAGQRMIFGVLTPSADEAGRAFPLAVFVTFDASLARDRMGSLLRAFSPFLQQVERVLGATSVRDGSQWSQQLGTLPIPDREDFERAHQEILKQLRTTRFPEFRQRLLSAAPSGQYLYALRTFVTACQKSAGREGDRSSIVMDCPHDTERDVPFWLELGRRLLRKQGGAPSFFWRRDQRPRLLVATGAPGASVLSFLASSEYQTTRLWPLETDRVEAIESARRALSASQQKVVEGGESTLEEVLTSLAGKA